MKVLANSFLARQRPRAVELHRVGGFIAGWGGCVRVIVTVLRLLTVSVATLLNGTLLSSVARVLSMV
jgi:hypothetical protein